METFIDTKKIIYDYTDQYLTMKFNVNDYTDVFENIGDIYQLFFVDSYSYITSRLKFYEDNRINIDKKMDFNYLKVYFENILSNLFLSRNEEINSDMTEYIFDLVELKPYLSDESPLIQNNELVRDAVNDKLDIIIYKLLMASSSIRNDLCLCLQQNILNFLNYNKIYEYTRNNKMTIEFRCDFKSRRYHHNPVIHEYYIDIMIKYSDYLEK